MDLFRSALSLVIHKNGAVSSNDIHDLLSYYESKKGIKIDEERYKQAVESALLKYKEHELALFICTDKPCLKKISIVPSEENATALSESLGCPVEITGCHWQCRQAPVVTLKSGNCSESVVECLSQEKWQHVKELVASAQRDFFCLELCV